MLESILFHGSDHVVDHPFRGGGKSHNDYGSGFYCTPDMELAREWACSSGSTSAFVNHYSLEPNTSLTVANLSAPPYHVLNWLAVLLKNRHFDLRHPLARQAKEYLLQTFLPPLSAFDIVRGYRADDSYFAIASSFLEGALSLEQLQHALRLGTLGEQVFMQSEKAFAALVFLTAETVDRSIYLTRRQQRDVQARNEFRSMATAAERTFILDILRQSWKNDDPRLR